MPPVPPPRGGDPWRDLRRAAGRVGQLHRAGPLLVGPPFPHTSHARRESLKGGRSSADRTGGIMTGMQPTRPGRPDPRQAQLAAAMSGAVDLAAVKARSEAAARAAAAPPPSAAAPAGAAGAALLCRTQATLHAAGV